MDREGAKGPFGEAFIRMSCYRCCTVIPGSTSGYEYPFYGQPAASALPGSSGGEGNLAAAAAGRAPATAPPPKIDKTKIILTADLSSTSRIAAGPTPIRRHTRAELSEASYDASFTFEGVRTKRMMVGEDCVKEMFSDGNLQFWFAKVKVPDDIYEVYVSLYLSIAGAALNCGAKSVPAEKYIINFLLTRKT